MFRHKQNKRGFTLVEVSLFLAITGLLFAGVIVGVQNSIYQQRFNDSVQSFAEFLRSVYSGVTNVENNLGKGNSNKAIYGKLVTFGEDKNSNKVSVYTVVGDMEESNSKGNVLAKLGNLKVNIKDESGNLAGILEEYKPRWSAQVKDNENKKFQGSLLIVRNPESGTVYTYFSEKNDPDEIFNNFSESGFKFDEDTDFCISPEGVNDLNTSRDIRVIARARNASGIEIVSDGDSSNKCKQ